MGERVCEQCGKRVVVGHLHVAGSAVGPDGSVTLDVRLRHYDCLPFDLRGADEFVAAAVAAAESGTRDAALQKHLTQKMGV